MTAPLTCAECDGPVVVVADAAGVPRYAHAAEPGNLHFAELPPVIVTYRRDGLWTDVSCPELGGQLGSFMDQGQARSLAAALLRRLSPTRNVREVWAGSGEG